MNYYALGQKIRKVRKAHALSQEALAERVGISTTHMSHIETGNTKPILATFVAIAEALDVSTDELLHDYDAGADRPAALSRVLQLLSSCSTQEVRILEDILQAAKVALEKHL